MTEIEHDLRTWMQERAARVHASPEILETDYRPRNRGRRPRLAIGGGLAAVAGTVTAVLSLAGGASTAFAGWSAQPTTASPAQLQAANSYCSANIPNPEPSAAGDRHPRAVHDHRLRRPRDIDADLQLLHGRARVSQRVRVDQLPTGDACRRTAVPLERSHLDGQRAAVRHDDRAGRLRRHGREPDAHRRHSGDGNRSERLGDRLVAG